MEIHEVASGHVLASMGDRFFRRIEIVADNDTGVMVWTAPHTPLMFFTVEASPLPGMYTARAVLAGVGVVAEKLLKENDELTGGFTAFALETWERENAPKGEK